MSKFHNRIIIDNHFQSEFDYYDCIVSFEVINGIGDSIVLFSIINKILKEQYKNPFVLIFYSLDYDYDFVRIFDFKYNKLIKVQKNGPFSTNAREYIDKIDIYNCFNNKYFWSFWDILSYNLDNPIPEIELKIKSIDMNNFVQNFDYENTCTVQVYTYNKERYVGIQNYISMIKSRWEDVFKSNPEKTFLLLGSGKDAKMSEFNLSNVISLVGKTSIKECCEIIISCSHHFAIESWTQVFCSAIRHPNTQFWDFESFPIYRPMVDFK